VHTCDAENIKHLLAVAFNDFELPRVRVSVMSSLLGTGIFTLNGKAWSHARGVLKPCLARQKIILLPDILEHHVVAILKQLSFNGSAIDLQPLFFSIAMDIATEFMMGHSTGMVSYRNDKARQFIEDYMLCSTEAVRKMRLGPLSFLRYNLNAHRAKSRVFAFVDNYVEETLQRTTQDIPYPEHNFTQQLAGAMHDKVALRDQVLHLLLASRDTTASLLSNLFFMLARKPCVYGKLRQSVLAVIGDANPTIEQLKEINYLRWCVNECMQHLQTEPMYQYKI
jgi:cytochrome P450